MYWFGIARAPLRCSFAAPRPEAPCCASIGASASGAANRAASVMVARYLVIGLLVPSLRHGGPASVEAAREGCKGQERTRAWHCVQHGRAGREATDRNGMRE